MVFFAGLFIPVVIVTFVPSLLLAKANWPIAALLFPLAFLLLVWIDKEYNWSSIRYPHWYLGIFVDLFPSVTIIGSMPAVIYSAINLSSVEGYSE